MNRPNHFRREFEKIVSKGQGLFKEKANQSNSEEAKGQAYDVLFSNPTPQGTKTFIERLKKLSILVNGAAELEEYLTELEAVKVAALDEIANEKAAKAAKSQARQEKAAAVTANGVPLKSVTRGDYEALAKLLSGARAEYVAVMVKTFSEAVAPLRVTQLSRSGLKFLGWKAALVKLSRNGVDGVLVEVRENAEEIAADIGRKHGEHEFDGYVVKLASKIGKTAISATVVGNLWSYSTLKIETKDEVQVWKTHAILNRSPLGTWFHQWPTIRVS